MPAKGIIFARGLALGSARAFHDPAQTFLPLYPFANPAPRLVRRDVLSARGRGGGEAECSCG